MKVINTEIKDVFILEPQVFGDARGWFYESWSKRAMEEAGLHYDFVQDNSSFNTKKYTLRGLHFQEGEAAQAKLVYCIRGAVLDVAVDIRTGSPDFGKWVALELTEENKRQLLIPRGFAHGYMTLTDEAEFCYKVDNFYCPEAAACIRWNDPDIGVKWGCEAPVLLERDAEAPLLKEYKAMDGRKL